MVVSELVQESPVTSIAGDEALTELEAKYAELQEQLHYTKEENSLLNQNLEEKEQKLSVLKDIWIKIKPCWKRLVVRIKS